MFVSLNGQRIFFDVVGSKLDVDRSELREKLTLLVLHGGPGFDHTGFRPAFDQFQDIAQVIYIDHRGNGRSVPSDPSTWTLRQWGQDIFDFCSALGIERPVVLGQSFGGMVAQAYATQYPDHPRAVILSSTAARIDLDCSYEILRKRGGDDVHAIARRFWDTGSDEVFQEYVRVCMPYYNGPNVVTTRHRAMFRPEVFRHFSLPGREIRSMDFRSSLSRIACPVLVLSGGLDPITPPHLAEEICASLQPGIATHLSYDHCGHGAFRDDPKLVFADLRRFLENL